MKDTQDDGVTCGPWVSAGETLRDKFAMRALTGFIAQANTPGAMDALMIRAREMGMTVAKVFAVMAYECADAMLVERAKRTDAPE